MLIKQSRIQSPSYFSSVPENTPIRIKVDNVARFPKELVAFGFEATDGSGTQILPSNCNKYAARNAEPYFTVNKKLPKEEFVQPIYWTYHQWAGRYEKREVTELVFATRKRYHRDYYPPYSVNFTYIEASEPYIVSDDITYTPSNHGKLINTVNMVLAVFGECFIDAGQASDKTERRRLNWNILPPGNYPWERIKNGITELTKQSNANETQTVLMLRNCEEIYKANPSFVAYGRSGFRGYAVFGFDSKGIYVLESVFPNNATYILGGDWEKLSKLSKAEILSRNLQKARIIHAKNWEREFKKVMEGS